MIVGCEDTVSYWGKWIKLGDNPFTIVPASDNFELMNSLGPITIPIKLRIFGHTRMTKIKLALNDIQRQLIDFFGRRYWI